jgi:subtilisin family serine protease
MSRSRRQPVGAEIRKIQPRLRMVANGSTTVNVVRAEQSASIAVRDQSLLKQVKPQREIGAIPVKRKQLPKSVKRGKLKKVSPDVYANVFIETTPDSSLPHEKSRRANLVTATVRLSEIDRIARRTDVSYVELGEQLITPTPIIMADRAGAPPVSLRRFGSAQKHQGGRGVLIGIVDVQGFDFTHPDFLDSAGKTRLVRIWDQGGNARPAPSDKAPFNYGSEFTQEHLNAALKAAPQIRVPAWEIEKQSETVAGSHGTHVASIAAGNRGVCPNADIAGVLISLPNEDTDKRKSFFDSTRIANAVDYLIELSKQLNRRLVINISLGTNGHAHDGSSAVSRWIDSALAKPGRCVCVASGNAGQEAAAFEGDIGFVMGRIHTSGRVPARGLNHDIEWLVVGNGVADISENEFEIWYSAQDRFAVSIRPPGGDWIGPIEPRQFIQNLELSDGTMLSAYNELYYPANGANYISIYLSPFLSDQGVVGVRAGQWIIRLHGREVRNGAFHGWIERDDPGRIGRVGVREARRFPSFFSERSNVDDSSVSSLACGRHIISAANLDEARERINITSSQGPTRDSRCKPDVAAPGTDIVAAKGFSDPDDLWIAMSGTSMASPFVAGVAGLMLAIEPRLTAQQIEGIIQRTSRPLPGSDFRWANNAGFGAIDPEACLEEAHTINQREDLKP